MITKENPDQNPSVPHTDFLKLGHTALFELVTNIANLRSKGVPESEIEACKKERLINYFGSKQSDIETGRGLDTVNPQGVDRQTEPVLETI